MLGVLTKLFSVEPNGPQYRVSAGGTEGFQPERQVPQNHPNDGGESSASTAPASPQWLSYYAKIAPQEISRWVNPEDGSGSISYEQLVENLNMFNIPVLPMRTFASPGTSGPRGLEDGSSTATVSPHKRTPLDVSSGSASALGIQGTQQEALNSNMGQRCPTEEILRGRSVHGSEVLRPASALGEHGSLAVEGVPKVPAGDLSRSEAHLRQSLESRTYSGTTLRGSVTPTCAEDSEINAVEQSPNIANCKPQLGCTALNGQALHVPVTATRSTYIGPVRGFRGTLSGVIDGGATRPGRYSQVPPDYVKVLNSEVRVFYDTEEQAGETVQKSLAPPRATSAGGLAAGGVVSKNGTPPRTTTSSDSSAAETPRHIRRNVNKPFVDQDSLTPRARLFRKPPPIFLAPVMKTGAEKHQLEARLTHSLSTTEDAALSITGDQDAQAGGITYSLGRYTWTAEEAALGTAHKGEPEMDEKVQRICTGAVFPAVLQPENRSEDSRQVETNRLEERGMVVSPQAAPIKIEDLGVPSIQKVCKEKIAQLQNLSGRISEFVRDDLYPTEAGEEVEGIVRSNKGGCGGLRASRFAKKASVVFVERPMLKAQMTPEGLWKAFQRLKEHQKKRLTMLEGSAADLSEVEALLCALHCRSVKATGCVGAFQDFFGKMKLNAYALRCGEGWALYPHAARIKHSCQPNVAYRNIDGLLVFFALRDIPEGSPITMSYVDQLYMPTQERRKRVIACKRIFCECSRCSDPIQPERTVLCPHCRPTKLCFIDEKTRQHAVNHSGGVATRQEDGAGLLQADGADAAESHEEPIADRVTKQMPDMEVSKRVPPEQVKKERERDVVSSEKHVASSCVALAYEGESKNSTDACSDVSPSSVCSEPDREDCSTAMRDKLCIVSTPVATKRTDADMEMTDTLEHRSADANNLESKGGRHHQEDSTCNVEKDGTSHRTSVVFSAACGSTELFVKHTQTADSDDDNKDCEYISESLCTSSLDAFTSADSNGNCSSSEFSEEEQEQSAKEAVPDKPDGTKQRVPLAENQTCTSGALSQEANMTKSKDNAHCVFEGEGRWRCAACGRQFTDNDMPVALEIYLTGYYMALRGRLGRPTPEAWNTECGQLIRTVEKVLGVEHWLYMAGHLMLAQLYLGMWMGGHVVDTILTQALRHAALVLSSASKPAFSAARDVDVAPLVTAVLRILLFNGRCHDFLEWVEKRGALQVIKETIGTYDEVYISFSTAYLYVRQQIDGGSEPSLGLLHRFAHASQYTIAVDAAYYEKKEAEDKERTARIKASKAEEAEARTREQTLRERLIKNIKRNIAALKASSSSEKPKQVPDVTFTSPDSVVGQYLRKYEAPGATVANATAALCQTLHRPPGKDDDVRQTFSNAALTAKAAYEQAKRVQQLAIEGRYPAGLSPPGGAPGNGYLPLIMLADPLETAAQQLRVVHKSSEVVQRERKRCEELKQMLHTCTNGNSSAVEDVNSTVDCKKHEGRTTACDARTHTTATNEEKSFVYRIPGLPGTAPGEFVTISQINHTKDGSYPALPFFRTFFYVDHEARTMTQRVGESEEPPLNIKVLGCGAEGVAPLTKEELDDLAAARYNFLHVEAERFNKEAGTALVLEMGRRAQEAAAALESLKLLDKQKSVSPENIDTVSPVDIFHEVNKAVRDVVIEDARTVERIEKFRERRITENGEDTGNVVTKQRLKKIHAEEQRDLSAQRTLDLPISPRIIERSLTAEAPLSAKSHGVTAPPLSGVHVPEWRLRTKWEVKSVPPCSVGIPPQEHSLNTGKATDQLASKDGVDRAVVPNEMEKHDLVNKGCAHRFLKPLDFSHIPPPPVLPAFARSPMVALHSQYKLARAAGRIACEQSQLRPPDLLGCSRVTTIQNSMLTAPPVSPVYTSNPADEQYRKRASCVMNFG